MTNMAYLIKQLGNPVTREMLAAKEAVIAVGSDAVEPLLAELSKPNSPAAVPIIIILGILKDPRAVPQLLGLLQSPDREIFKAAATALAELQEQKAVPLIQQLVLDLSINRTSFDLLVALDKLGQRPWVIEYARHLLTDTSWTKRDRVVAIRALGEMNDPVAAELIFQQMQLHSPEIDFYAFAGLANSKYTPAVDHLITLLAHSSPVVRGAVAKALGEIGDKRAVKPLKALLRDKTPTGEVISFEERTPVTVRMKAAEALQKLLPSSSWNFGSIFTWFRGHK